MYASQRTTSTITNTRTTALYALTPKSSPYSSERERDIRRTIALLKEQGRLPSQRKRTTTNPEEDGFEDGFEDGEDDEEGAAAVSEQRTLLSSGGGGSRADSDALYEARVRDKLGARKSRLLRGVRGAGTVAASVADQSWDVTSASGGTEEPRTVADSAASMNSGGPALVAGRRAVLGALPREEDCAGTGTVGPKTAASTDDVTSTAAAARKPIINPDLFDLDDDDDEDTAAVTGRNDEDEDVQEQELVDRVEQALLEKRRREQREREEMVLRQAREARARLERERRDEEERQQQSQQQRQQPQQSIASSSTGQLTSGVGGTWTPPTSASSDDDPTGQPSGVEYYQPKTGSWGAFPRPKDISRAYGGGRRIGPGFSGESQEESEEATRRRLQQYREKVGIDVPSERDHANEIDEALRIANYAMQRGRYATGVSALEKVTKYCSTNSKVGGKVFLELAMAYEAVGRTEEAITVYRTLSNSRTEDVKFNAKRLLYGIEAMQFMQNDVKSPEFSRRKVRNTFIDTTGFGNIASHFDDVYQTAYVDLEGGYYKKLTESVVRSSREARQILLKATNAGEIGRLRVVQALRSLSRSFDEALEREVQINAPQPEPVAVMNGVPIAPSRRSTGGTDAEGGTFALQDGFVLTDAPSMLSNLDGEWKLQLLADKRGDGVKYFDSQESWQAFDAANGTYVSCGPSGFASLQRSGSIEFNAKKRILRRRGVQSSGGGPSGTGGGGGGVGLLATLLPILGAGVSTSSRTGFAGAVSNPQQVVLVDSVLLVTRGVPNVRAKPGGGGDTNDKDYFAVWRRVEQGTYSSSSPISPSANSPR